MSHELTLRDVLGNADLRPRCPDCGLYAGHFDGPHNCRVPMLREAIGVPISGVEERHVRWLAGCDRETADVFAAMFRRVRSLQ